MSTEAEMDKEIRKTLKNIFRHIGVETSWAHDATLRTFLERLIRKSQSNS